MITFGAIVKLLATIKSLKTSFLRCCLRSNCWCFFRKIQSHTLQIIRVKKRVVNKMQSEIIGDRVRKIVIFFSNSFFVINRKIFGWRLGRQICCHGLFANLISFRFPRFFQIVYRSRGNINNAGIKAQQSAFFNCCKTQKNAATSKAVMRGWQTERLLKVAI